MYCSIDLIKLSMAYLCVCKEFTYLPNEAFLTLTPEIIKLRDERKKTERYCDAPSNDNSAVYIYINNFFFVFIRTIIPVFNQNYTDAELITACITLKIAMLRTGNFVL